MVWNPPRPATSGLKCAPPSRVRWGGTVQGMVWYGMISYGIGVWDGLSVPSEAKYHRAKVRTAFKNTIGWDGMIWDGIDDCGLSVPTEYRRRHQKPQGRLHWSRSPVLCNGFFQPTLSVFCSIYYLAFWRRCCRRSTWRRARRRWTR